MNLLEKTLEYIFVPSCGICNKIETGYICKECEIKIEKYKINEISLINLRKTIGLEKYKDIEKMHIFKYKDLIRNTIIQYKFNDKSYLYKTFSEIILKDKKAFDFIKTYDIIIPVPIHKKKLRKRGYNQSELIANEIAKKMNKKMYLDVLIKIKDNKSQSTLNKVERKLNIKNVYKIKNANKIYNKKVLIFDDIYTTGATIDECIKTLENINVKQIGILTLAKD